MKNLKLKKKYLNKLLYNFNESDLNFVPVRISNEIKEFL